MSDKKDYISTVGKRKEAVARIRLYTSVKSGLTIGEISVKKGDMLVNNKKIEQYFSDKVSQLRYLEPFKITNNIDKYVVSIKVSGGGIKSQLGAVIIAISRALSTIDEKNKQILRKKGFLTRDARVRERRKVGMGGKARRRKQSPKR